MPSCAFTPCSLKGWWINFISVTRSAESINFSDAPLPVKTTCVSSGRKFIPFIISSSSIYPSFIATMISSKIISL